MKKVSKSLEEILKPQDKTYTLLGGVSGFKAQYKVKDIEKIEAILVLLPRQSFLYLPVSYLIRKRDFLFVIFKLKGGPKYEAHIIRKNDRVVRELKPGIRIEKNSFVIWGEVREAIQNLTGWFPHFPVELYHFATLPNEKLVYLKITPKGMNILNTIVQKIREERW